jgi:peroxiredoxin/predicted 2-oxoglutarate/Fe(II)-dependent dioxygenase YbiX
MSDAGDGPADQGLPAMTTAVPGKRFVNLLRGDPAPWFRARSTANPEYNFSLAAGRFIVLCFFGTASDKDGRSAVAAIAANRELFDDRRMCVFGISFDPSDEREQRVAESLPGIRHFWDFDGAISRAYGALAADEQTAAPKTQCRRFWMVIDPTLRVRAVFPFEASHDAVFAYLRALPEPGLFAGFEIHAPIIMLPDVFEPALCKRLIEAYEVNGSKETGFMTERDGITTMRLDADRKRRRDHTLTDQELIAAARSRISRRIAPEIQKIHQFSATRIERYIVSCYSAEDRGHFTQHRDNTTKGTAHRRFAVSINLNAEFEGGEISFPEYGPRSFKPPPGGAVVFSCSLLHAVSPVVEGRRFAFLPFLFDEEAAKVREANKQFLDEAIFGKNETSVQPQAQGSTNSQSTHSQGSNA